MALWGATGVTSTSTGSEDGGFIASAPLQNFSFWMLVEGVMSVPLKSVRPFQKVNQYERIREGGVNDYVTLKRMQIQEPHQLVVERYMMNSVFDPLANGAELTLPIILAIDHPSKSWGDTTHAARFYAFTGCTVMSKEYGELNAEKSGLGTEVITIGYKMMYVVPNLLSIGGDPSKAPGTNSNIGDDAVAETMNKQLEAQQKEEQKKKDQAKKLDEWAKRREEENRSGVVDPTEYGGQFVKDETGKIKIDDRGKPVIDFGTPKTTPKESDYFQTNSDGTIKKDSKGNPVPKGSNKKEQAKNAAEYAAKKAEAAASQKDIEDRKEAYYKAQKILDKQAVKTNDASSSDTSEGDTSESDTVEGINAHN